MAVLPGIDANDEAKTAAVFQFYTAGEPWGVPPLRVICTCVQQRGPLAVAKDVHAHLQACNWGATCPYIPLVISPHICKQS
jgi:hypothetical protein